MQRRTVLRVRAGAGEWRGPWQRTRESVRILARSAEGRGRSTGPVARPDSTLLSVLPFMDNSVCDGGDIHSEVSSQPSSLTRSTFKAPPRLEQGLDDDRHLASCGLPVYRYRAYQIQPQMQACVGLRRHSSTLALAVPFCAVVLVRFYRSSLRLPWWRWVQPSRVSSLTASRSSFDCLASSTGAGTRESAHSQSNWCALNVCCRRVFCWVSSPMWPRPAYATASAILLGR